MDKLQQCNRTLGGGDVLIVTGAIEAYNYLAHGAHIGGPALAIATALLIASVLGRIFCRRSYYVHNVTLANDIAAAWRRAARTRDMNK
jgi:uncharacterized membrane protein